MTPVDPRNKVLPRDELLARYARPRALKLVFTNGCFDLLHRGHAEYLYAARTRGDALVVALNTDDSVRRLKGPGRPVLPQNDRAFLIASFGCVDAVTLFHEDTPLELISALLPDVLVKGGDYRPEDVVGRAEVERAGGRVVILPYVAHRSTTHLLRNIRAET